MDDRRFDDLARAVGSGVTRRRLLGSLAAAGAGLVALPGSALAACRGGGRPCTKGRHCCSGVCIPGPRNRGTCACGPAEIACGGACQPAAKFTSDPNNCGGCGVVCPSTQCGPGVCSGGVCGIAVQVGAACLSGDLCTENDTCQPDGSCAGTPISCPVGDARCASATCDPATGQCVVTNAPAGAACSNGVRCDGLEACDGNGACVSGQPLDCNLLVADSRCGSAIRNTTTGECEVTLKAAGSNCGSTDPCTGRQTCNADGICERAAPIDCSGQATACTAAVCNASTETCDLIDEPAGTPCGDGDLCTGIPACDGAGTCLQTSGPDCAALETPCKTAVCDPDKGICDVTNKPVGTVCIPATACTAAGTCDANGACQPGPATDCSHLDTACQTGVCNTTTGTCEAQVANNGSACDFNIPCVTGGTCQNGVCSSQPRQCFDPGRNVCARAYCDPTKGPLDTNGQPLGDCVVENFPAGTPCGNNVSCDGIETCDGTGVCRTTPGTGFDCGALSTDCQTFFCDTQAGLCSSLDKADRTSCDNGNGVCLSGVCKRGGNDTTCAPGNIPCISGGCVSGNCVISGVGLACLTDWDCSTGICVGGICQDGSTGAACDATADCRGGLVCKNRTCGIQTFPNGTTCSTPDTCDSGACGRIITAADRAVSPVCCTVAGGACTANSDCCSPQGAPQACVAGVCQAAAVGTTCTADIDCPTGLYCNASTRVCAPVGQFGDVCSATSLCASNLRCCNGTCRVCCQADNQSVPAFSGCGPGSNKICCGGQCASVTDTNCGCGVDCTTGTGCTATNKQTCVSKGVCSTTTLTNCDDPVCIPGCVDQLTCTGGVDLFTYSQCNASEFQVIISGYSACKSNADCGGSTPYCVSDCAGKAFGTLYCSSNGFCCPTADGVGC